MYVIQRPSWCNWCVRLVIEGCGFESHFRRTMSGCASDGQAAADAVGVLQQVKHLETALCN